MCYSKDKSLCEKCHRIWQKSRSGAAEFSYNARKNPKRGGVCGLQRFQKFNGREKRCLFFGYLFYLVKKITKISWPAVYHETVMNFRNLNAERETFLDCSCAVFYKAVIENTAGASMFLSVCPQISHKERSNL